jgi:hypothetical protein
MPTKSAAHPLLAVLVLVLCLTRVTTSDGEQQHAEVGQDDELDVQSTRVFLEKVTEQLQQKNKLMQLVGRSSFKDRLDSELERAVKASDVQQKELKLLREFREFLYGQLDESRCKLGERSELVLQNLTPGSSLAKLVEGLAQPAAPPTDSNKLDELLLDRRLKQIEFCKPRWDRKLAELIESRLNETMRERMLKLYNHLIAFEAKRFALDEIAVLETRDAALESLEQFAQLLREPPRPASLLIFMNEQFPSVASELKLDHNMKNERLSRSTLEKAVRNTIVPICQNVCETLRPIGRHYASRIFNERAFEAPNADGTYNFRWRLYKMFRDQPARVTKALVVSTTCCKLLNPTVSETILNRLHLQATGSNKGKNSPRAALCRQCSQASARSPRTPTDHNSPRCCSGRQS